MQLGYDKTKMASSLPETQSTLFASLATPKSQGRSRNLEQKRTEIPATQSETSDETTKSHDEACRSRYYRPCLVHSQKRRVVNMAQSTQLTLRQLQKVMPSRSLQSLDSSRLQKNLRATRASEIPVSIPVRRTYPGCLSTHTH